MPVFELRIGGYVIGVYKTRDKLNAAIDEIKRYSPDAAVNVWVTWDGSWGCAAREFGGHLK